MPAATLDNDNSDDLYCPTWLKAGSHSVGPPDVSAVRDAGVVTHARNVSFPDHDDDKELYRTTVSFLDTELQYHSHLVQCYQGICDVLFSYSKAENDVEVQRYKSLFLHDLQVVLKYNNKFCQKSKGPERSGTAGNVGTVLNDTMLIHAEYKRSMISLMVKSEFKKTLLMKLMGADADAQLCHGVVELAVERLFHYRRWLKQLIDIRNEASRHRTDLNKRGRGDFETFELQLALLKVNKILEAADAYGEVTTWEQVQQFEFDSVKTPSMDAGGPQDIFGSTWEQDYDVRLSNSEVGADVVAAGGPKVPRNSELECSATHNEVMMMHDLIKLKRMSQNLKDLEDGLRNYTAEIRKFVQSQMYYCQAWYDFFVSPELTGQKGGQQATNEDSLFGLNSASTIAYIYTSFIERWQQRHELTEVFLEKLQREVGDRVHLLLKLIPQISGQLSGQGAVSGNTSRRGEGRYDASRHALVKEVVSLLEFEEAVTTGSTRSEVAHAFVYKWSQLQVEWMAAMIGPKGLHEYRELLCRRASSSTNDSTNDSKSNAEDETAITINRSEPKTKQTASTSSEIRHGTVTKANRAEASERKDGTDLEHSEYAKVGGSSKYSDIVRGYNRTIRLTMELLSS